MKTIDADELRNIFRTEFLHDCIYEIDVETVIELIDIAPTIEMPNLIAERARSYQNGYTAGYHNGLRIGIGLPPPIAEKTLDQLTGEWIFDGEHWRCSVCKETPWYDGSPMACGYKFCPMCGSPMKGEEK